MKKIGKGDDSAVIIENDSERGVDDGEVERMRGRNGSDEAER